MSLQTPPGIAHRHWAVKKLSLIFLVCCCWLVPIAISLLSDPCACIFDMCLCVLHPPPPPRSPTLLLPPPPPTAVSWEALLAVLQGEYSTVLYGEPGRVDTACLQVIWTSLLSNAALQTVEAIGVCHWQPDPPHRLLFYPYSMGANPHGSLWRRPSVPMEPASSYSWIEVTHCAKGSNQGKQLTRDTLPWFYMAHGSGVSLNVGRSAAIDLRAPPPGCTITGEGAPNANALRSELRRCFDGVDALDSVQLMHDYDPFSDEERSVIVLLSTRVLSEMRPIADAIRRAPSSSNGTNTSTIMCGRWPDLFPCTASSPPVDYMSRCTHAIPSLLKPAMRPCGRRGPFGNVYMSPPSPPPPSPPSPPDALKSIYWLHIPKTSSLFATTVLTYACGDAVVQPEATSTLTQSGPPIMNDDCQGRLSHKQCCSAAGHSRWFHDPLPYPEDLPSVGNVVLLLREPKQRVASAYFYLRGNGKCCGQGWGWSSENSSNAFRAAAAHADLKTFLTLPGVSGCQTKMLVGRGCMDIVAPTSIEVERAAHFVQRSAAFVGLSEQYQASVCLWHEHFGGSLAPSEMVAIGLMKGSGSSYDTAPLSMGAFVDHADEQTYTTGVRRFRAELSKTPKCR